MKKIIPYLFFALPLLSSAQLFNGEEYEYNSEWLWGINKNTNGGLIGGLILRYSRSEGNNVFQTYGIEFSNVRHKSETRYAGLSGARFIYGKSHYLYAIRLQYGREKLMFYKSNQKGVQISVAASVGPSIGLVVPYYVLTGNGSYEPFNQNRHHSPVGIAGPGKIFQGLKEARVIPGINVKSSIIFEFGTYKNNVAGMEIGAMLEVYTKEVVLVPTQPNKSLFTSVFFTFFWGTRK